MRTRWYRKSRSSFCLGKPEVLLEVKVWALQDGEIFTEMMAEKLRGLM